MGSSGKTSPEGSVKGFSGKAPKIFFKRSHNCWRKIAMPPPSSPGVDAALSQDKILKMLTGKPRSLFRMNQLKTPRKPKTSKKLQSELPKLPSKRKACHSPQGEDEGQKDLSSSAQKARIRLEMAFEKENIYDVIPSPHCEGTSMEAVVMMNTQITAAPLKPEKKKRLSLGKINKRVMCYTCGKCVGKNQVQDHLFFGRIECTKCKIKILKCDIFRNSISCQLANTDCTHEFLFCSVPSTYMLAMLQDPFDNPALKSTINDRMSSYILSLEDLAKKDPWKQAVSQCQRYLKGEETTESVQKNPELIELEDNDLQLDDSEIIEIKEESLQLNDSEARILFSIPKYETETPTRSQDYPIQDDMNGFLLSQSYTLDHMDDIVNYQVMPAGSGKSPLESPREGCNAQGSVVSSKNDSSQTTIEMKSTGASRLSVGIDVEKIGSAGSTTMLDIRSSRMAESADDWKRVESSASSKIFAKSPSIAENTVLWERAAESPRPFSASVASSSTMTESNDSWKRYNKIPKTSSMPIASSPTMIDITDSWERETETQESSIASVASSSTRTESNDSWKSDNKTPETSSISVASSSTMFASTDSWERETETQESSITSIASSSTMTNSSRSWERERERLEAYTMPVASTSTMNENTDHLALKILIRKTFPKTVANGPPMTKIKISSKREVQESSGLTRQQGADNSPRRVNVSTNIPIYTSSVSTDNSKAPKIINASNAPKTTETLRHKFIKIPSTPPYYVIRDSIEECPMCYTDVCPTRFQPKFNNCILASECVGCDLVFYIAIPPLNESCPKISIITGDPTEEVMKPKSKKRKKDS